MVSARFDDRGGNTYRIQFFPNPNPNSWEMRYTGPLGFNNTGLQNQYGVLATILDCLDSFLSMKKPETFWFSCAKADKHAKLYTAMVKFLSKQIEKSGYKHEVTVDDSVGKQFTFTR